MNKETPASSQPPAQQPLNILFRVGPFPELSETFVLSQIRGLAQLGHHVAILSDGPGISSADDITDWQFISKRLRYITPPALAFAYKRLPFRIRLAWLKHMETVAAEKADVIICNFGWFGEKILENIGTKYAHKLVTIFHGADLSRSIQRKSESAYPLLIREETLLLPISEFWRDKLLSMGASPDRVCVHRMGVDLNQFSFTERKAGANDRFKFITVCRLVEKKGIIFALEAMALLRKQNPEIAFSYDIIGDGPLNPSLKQQAADLGLLDIVTFHGAIAPRKINTYLQDADAFVLPSIIAEDGDMEGIPVSLMEAMASGLPVVSTRHSGIPELIEDGLSGLLVNEKDAGALANALARIAQNPAERIEFARGGRTKIESTFDQAAWNNALEAHASRIAKR